MKTEKLIDFKINKLTNEQYQRELAAGNINENELYLTPDDTYSKGEISAMLPKVIVTDLVDYVKDDGFGYDIHSLVSSELTSLKQSNKERIVFVVLSENIDTNDKPYVVKINDYTFTNDNALMLWNEGSWNVGYINEAFRDPYIQVGQALILAVKGDGIGLKFEYIHWLNPPKLLD